MRTILPDLLTHINQWTAIPGALLFALWQALRDTLNPVYGMSFLVAAVGGLAPREALDLPGG